MLAARMQCKNICHLLVPQEPKSERGWAGYHARRDFLVPARDTGAVSRVWELGLSRGGRH